MNARIQGAGLIEVLICLLVITLGLLGFAGLQLQSLRTNQAAQLQTRATGAAYDLIERMRANRSIAALGGYRLSSGADARPVPECNARNCSAQQLAQRDLALWKENLAHEFPEGDGEVEVRMRDGILEVLVTVLVREPRHSTPTRFQLRTLL